jgi:Flp pilus assembly protein TadD
MDDWIGYFFRELERRGLWEDTIVVLVADHGEGLGEYGEKTHGMFIYRPTTRVPLLIRYPGAVPAGARVPDRVSVVDIVPTILDLLGMDPPPGADGRSLVPLTRGEPGDADREIYSEVFIPRSFNWSDLSGVRAGDRFYISAPRPELYALEAGRNETGDLSSVEPQTLAAMAARLDRILATSSPSDVEQVAVNEEMVEQLEALGYFMGGGEPTAGSPVKKEELADPKDRIALFNLSQRVNSLSAAGMVDEAIDILRVMVREDPRNPRFLMELGGLLTEVGRHEEAIARLRDALALNPDDGRLHFMLGQCYEEWGRGDDAVLAYGVALETGGQHFLTLFHLGMIHIGEGRWDEAEAVFARARRLRPGDPGVLNNLGYIAIKGRGDHQGGIRLIEKALAAAPDDPRVLGSLGSALLGAGDSENAIRRLEEALRLVPDDREIMRLLEQAYTEAGSREGLEMLRGRRAAIESLGGPPSTPGSGRPRPK